MRLKIKREHIKLKCQHADTEPDCEKIVERSSNIKKVTCFTCRNRKIKLSYMQNKKNDSN